MKRVLASIVAITMVFTVALGMTACDSADSSVMDSSVSDSSSVTNNDSQASENSEKWLTIENGVLVKCDENATGKVVIPEGVTAVVDDAFAECINIRSVEIPASVEAFEESAPFYDCERLGEINVAEGNANFCSEDGVLFNKDKTTILEYPRARMKTEYTMPDTVTTIGAYAFAYNLFLCDLTIPESVKTIEPFAFYSDYLITQLELPQDLETIGKYAFWGAGLTSVELPKGIKRIEEGTFLACFELVDVKLPDGLTFIGETAFAGCESLEQIEIPDSVTTLDRGVFMMCDKLRSLHIPENVSSIGQTLVTDCTALESITVDENSGHFCTVDNVVFSKDMKTLVFYPQTKTDTTYTIPDGTEVIEANAFRRCEALTEIIIPEGVTTIGEWTFFECEALSSILLPSTVKTMGNRTFSQSGITSIVLPEGIDNIGKYAFAYCSELESVKLPETLTTISEGAFWAVGLLPKS